jgi:RimJ/RimL family protein N-acetyltransferase/acyl carrier protein
VAIRPTDPADYEFLYGLVLDPDIAPRWRYRGSFPDRTQFSQSLTGGVLVQFTVTSKRNPGTLIGLVTTYNANLREGWAYLAALSDPKWLQRGHIIEGIELLLNYVFEGWPLRKIYLEVIDFNRDQFKYLPEGLAAEEGRLREHVFHGHRYWDLVTMAITREAWVSFEARRRARAAEYRENVEVILSLEEFWRHVADQLSLPISREEEVDPETSLAGLGFDSMSMVELAVLIDDLTGTKLDWTSLPETVRDAYTWYGTAASCPKDLDNI